MKKALFNLLLDMLTFNHKSLHKSKLSLLNLAGAKVDYTAYVDIGVRIRFPCNLIIGRATTLGDGCKLMCFGRIHIEEYSQLANDVILVSGTHDIETRKPLNNCSIKIGRYCWIGTGVKIAGNVTVGEGCIIGAGAVVINDLPPWSICVGTPARPIKFLPKPNDIITSVGVVEIHD